MEENFLQGASKKKNFSYIDLKSEEFDEKFLILKLELDRKNMRSKTNLAFPEKQRKEKSSTFINEKAEENDETNLMDIKKDYEKTIVSRDLDQSLSEISNIKIINNTFSTCNVIDEDEMLDLTEKMAPFLMQGLKFAKSSQNTDNQEKAYNITVNNNNTVDNNTNDQKIDENKKFLKKKINPLFNHNLFRNLIFSPQITESTFKAHLLNTYKGLVYAKKFLKPPSSQFLREKMVSLPEIKGHKFINK